MNIRQSLLAQLILLVVSSVYSWLTAPSLTSVVPTHWGIDGKPDAFGSPSFSLWFGPGIMAIMMLLTWAMPKLSPKKFEIDRFEKTYGILMFLVGLMMLGMHVIILMATAGKPIDIGRWMMTVIGVFFAIFGNFMGKVRKNFYMGVRTPWTLASDRVWEATHRHAATLWFFGGLGVAAMSLLGVPMWLSLTAIIVLSFWPVVQSYLIYQKLERH